MECASGTAASQIAGSATDGVDRLEHEGVGRLDAVSVGDAYDGRPLLRDGREQLDRLADGCLHRVVRDVRLRMWLTVGPQFCAA